MQMCRIVLYFFLSFLLFVQESDSRTGFCHGRSPVVNICTDQTTAAVQSVYIDTVDVPNIQQTFCECIIATLQYETEFSFVTYGHQYPKGVQFEINDLVLKESAIIGSTYLMGETPIHFSTSDHNGIGGICVNVYTENRSNFRLSCKKSSKPTTGQPTTTLSSENVTESKSHIGPDQVPIVSAISCIVCLVLVVAVFVFCKRRHVRKRQVTYISKSIVKQEQDNDYYMTENPMYNVNENQPRVQLSENEYHYIEHDQLHCGRSTVQYESVTDSPIDKKFPAKPPNHGQHYDYTTCLTVSKENGHVHENINTSDLTNERGTMPTDKRVLGEAMYDSTNTSAVKQFSGINDYHHLSTVVSRKKFVMDTYNTIGNVGVTEEEEEESEYDVTHSH